jgi:hypothetical protein
MYIAGRVLQTIITDNDEKKQQSLKRISNRDDLLITEIKWHLHEDYLNGFINFRPILRNLEVNTSKAQIGD